MQETEKTRWGWEDREGEMERGTPGSIVCGQLGFLPGFFVKDDSAPSG